MILDMIVAMRAGHPGCDRWDSLINQIAPQYSVPPNLLKAIILYESGGDPNIISFDTGCGLCQITSGVIVHGAGVDTSYSYETQDILDPAYNMMVACRDHIKPAMQTFPANLNAIVAAYNAGIGAVTAALQAGRLPSSVTYASWYVPAVTQAFAWFCAASHKGPQ